MDTSFDLFNETPLSPPRFPISTLGHLLFRPHPGRNEHCKIILSHLENQYVEITLHRLRELAAMLMARFAERDVRRGQTVVLPTFPGCNEMITAVYFIALAAMGCRVFLPMFAETDEFPRWLELTQARHLFLPEEEIASLDGHDKEKSMAPQIRAMALARGVQVWNSSADFGLHEALLLTLPEASAQRVAIPVGLDSVSPADEVLVVSTSGTSGRSRLVVYTHEAYFWSCLSWEQAGFFAPAVLGGTGFTPLFSHTMGVRAFLNALWTGSPVCLIITEWFLSKPEIVRHFLLKMMPAHITGGPAVYNAFLELYRVFPELKTELSPHFRTLVSSGAAYNPATAREVFDATGRELHNAFGTTETQQVFSTLLGSARQPREGSVPLGGPLPGVRVGLRKSAAGPDHFRLFVQTPFAHKRCLGEEPTDPSGYFDTGDLVVLGENAQLSYVGREKLDYFKDGFGVKIPLRMLTAHYAELLDRVLHAEFRPLVNSPGLAALLFVAEPACPAGQTVDGRHAKKYVGLVQEINNRLIHTLGTFEYLHRHVCRIAIINESPPLTAKGTVSAKQIAAGHEDLLERLGDVRKDASGIKTVECQCHSSDQFSRYVSPHISSLMSALRMDRTYHRAGKDSLFSYVAGQEVEVLDLVGGFGTNLLGHAHPAVAATIAGFLSSGAVAISNQLSNQHVTGLLAEKLNLLFGTRTGRSYRVVFGNSGSEAVEIALHHALFEWRKAILRFRDRQLQAYAGETHLDVAGLWRNNLRILTGARIRMIAVSRAFHGQSTGARSLMGNAAKRAEFAQLSGIQTMFVDDQGDDWRGRLDAIHHDSVVTIGRIVPQDGRPAVVPWSYSTIVAAIAEPVMGEGGVRVVNPDLLQELAAHEYPLISDEIQCGLGRTGDVPAFPGAPYYLIGKALGGGFEKIAAVLIDSTRYQPDFSEHYLSTFGNGELAAQVGLSTLAIIDGDQLLQRVRHAGEYLARRLGEIQGRYPSVIRSVEGKGLMLALRLNPACAANNALLRILFQVEKAGYLLAAWFLNCCQIRILPTLSATDTLRIEPSAYLEPAETDRFCRALDELCRILVEGRIYDLCSFLMDGDPFSESGAMLPVVDHFNPSLESPAPGAKRVAFLAHFVLPLKELRMLAPDLERASDTGLRILFRRLQILMELKPIQILAANLFDNKVHFSFYGIPLDSSEFEHLHKSGQRRQVVAKIQDAVDLAAAGGAEVVSLGGYTSILTNNGLALVEPRNTRIITGNTLTAASGLRHLRNTVRQQPEFDRPNVIAIVGSTGNIGRIITEAISEQEDICAEILLVSRRQKRQRDFVRELRERSTPQVSMTCATGLDDLRKADVIIVCSNTNDPLVLPHHIAPEKPVLISDLSVPSAVSPEVGQLPNVTMMPFAAYVSLPLDPQVVISSYSPPGTVFCCAGEAILLGLERCDVPLRGRVMLESVKAISALAGKYDLFAHAGSVASFRTGGG